MQPSGDGAKPATGVLVFHEMESGDSRIVSFRKPSRARLSGIHIPHPRVLLLAAARRPGM